MNSSHHPPDDRWQGIRESLEFYYHEHVEALDNEHGVERLLVADAHVDQIKPKLHQALLERFGHFLDLERGGLTPAAEEQFANAPNVLEAARRHRAMRDDQPADSQPVPPPQAVADPVDSAHYIPLEKLIEHPINQAIFDTDEEADEALRRSIEDHGQLEPIVVLPDYRVLSGARRLRVSRAMGRTTIRGVTREVGSEDEEELLLSYNLRRRMTMIERLRVFGRFLAIETARAAARQRDGKSLPENSPGGDARDLAARMVGLSGRSAELGLRVARELDGRRQVGNHADEVATVAKALDKSILGGCKAAERLGWFAELPGKQPLEPVADPLPAALAASVASLEKNPTAHQLFARTSPALRKTLGSIAAPNRVRALRDWAQSLLALADRLEAQSSPPPAP